MDGVTEKRERVTATLTVEHSKPWSHAHADAVDSALAGLQMEVEGDTVTIAEVDDIRWQTPTVIPMPSPDERHEEAVEAAARAVVAERHESQETPGERGYVPTTAERQLVGQLRVDVEVEREGRHQAEDLLEHAVTMLRSIASAEPKSDQARWMVEVAKRGIPKGADG